MAAIDHDRFNRVLTRCAELAAEPGMKQSIVRVHTDILKDASDHFRSAHWDVQQAQTAYGEKSADAERVLAALDAPYRETRSVVLAFVPAAKLPDTLKVQPTDTDRQNAIESLRKVLDSHTGKPWADEQKIGEFGQQAPAALVVLSKAIATNNALADARHARTVAYDAAYERYLRFKQVVRDALGQSSKHYKRIHLRRSSQGDDLSTPATAPVTAEEANEKEVSAPGEALLS
jgi:hypothetical protein